jgi:hypothetical protein
MICLLVVHCRPSNDDGQVHRSGPEHHPPFKHSLLHIAAIKRKNIVLSNKEKKNSKIKELFEPCHDKTNIMGLRPA